MFPNEFDGVYFFGNYETNYIKFLDLHSTGTTVEGVYDFKPSPEIPGNTNNIVFLEEGIDCALYYINYRLLPLGTLPTYSCCSASHSGLSR